MQWVLHPACVFLRASVLCLPSPCPLMPTKAPFSHSQSVVPGGASPQAPASQGMTLTQPPLLAQGWSHGPIRANKVQQILRQRQVLFASEVEPEGTKRLLQSSCHHTGSEDGANGQNQSRERVRLGPYEILGALDQAIPEALLFDFSVTYASTSLLC